MTHAQLGGQRDMSNCPVGITAGEASALLKPKNLTDNVIEAARLDRALTKKSELVDINANHIR